MQQFTASFSALPKATGVNAAKATSTTSPTGATQATPRVIRTTAPDTTLPRASLFATRPDPSGRYLVETDPRFTNLRQWLSSDYLLNALGHAPASVHKRLGDGFYEQQLSVGAGVGVVGLEGSLSGGARRTTDGITPFGISQLLRPRHL